MVSGDLYELSISKLANGAPIDCFGVGTELSTSRDNPAINSIYKLVAVKVRNPDKNNDEYEMLYKLKTSVGKETYPGHKQVGRFIEINVLEKGYLILEYVKDGNKVLVK
jgi:nicotinate phosphoribosyltransferase